MSELPVLPPGTVDAAIQGSWCPKLCTFACPVHRATGRDDAVPWSFHRAVTDLTDGRRGVEEVRPDLVACTGCLACQVPCTFDQDVPAQVRDARAVARPTSPRADLALARLAAGHRPDGTPGPDSPGRVPTGATVLHVGCHDGDDVVVAARRLLAAAGHDVVVVGDGCCGQLARDLGDTATTDDRAAHRRTQLAAADTVVVLDPHCAPALGDAIGNDRLTDLWSLLADTPPAFEATRTDAVTYHDPCVLARGAGVVDAPRSLLAAAGYWVAEPEHHGRHTGCSGAGMGLDLLDPAAAGATAHTRADQLAATADLTITACSRALDHLAAAGVHVRDLAVALADRLPETE